MSTAIHVPKSISKAQALFDTGKFSEVLETLAPVLEAQPLNPSALYLVGNANAKVGNKALAHRQLESFMHDSADWRGKRIMYYRSLHENGLKANKRDLGYENTEIKHKPVFISSSPRSGVNLLSGSIHHYSGLPFKYTYQEGDDDQQLLTRDFVDATSEKCIISQHTRCNHRVLATLQALEISPIILVNDIYESLVSYVHHIDTHKSPRTLAANWNALSFEEKLDHVIELQAFWNFDFYASWIRAKRDGLIAFDLIMFSDLANKLPAVLKKIATEQDFVNESKNLEESLKYTRENADWLISKEIEEADALQLNKARSVFNKEQLSRIDKLASLITDLDLSPLGV